MSKKSNNKTVNKNQQTSESVQKDGSTDAPKKLSQRIDALLIPATYPLATDASFERQKLITPGAEILVAENDAILFHKTYGIVHQNTGNTPKSESKDKASEITPLKKGMIFDLGSATQVLATVPVFMKLIEQRLVNPDIRVSSILQTFGSAGKETMKVSQLLNHTSGYPANLPLHRTLIKGSPTLNSLLTRRSALHLLYKEIYRSRLDNVPGKVYQRSDIGYLLLGQILEMVSGTPINKLFTQLVARPFRLGSTGYIDLEQIRRKTLLLSKDMLVATAHCSWRNKQLHGEVLDEVAWAAGGITAHNGLFGSAEDIINYLAILNASLRGDSSKIPTALAREYLCYDQLISTENESETSQTKAHPYGWEHYSISENKKVLGFWSSTGTGLWLDPLSGKSLVFLSNGLQISKDLKKTKELALQVLQDVLKN